MKEGIGHLDVGLAVCPWLPQLGLVLPDVLISSVPCQGIRLTCPSDGSLEAAVPRDDLVRQNPPVTPAAHAQALRIGHALRDGVIDCRQHVLTILVSPVSPNAKRKLLPSAR